jgi:hypothetical protein
MTDPTTTTDFHALIAKEDNLLTPTGKSDRYATVVETVRRVMIRNEDADLFVACSMMDDQPSAVQLYQDVYEDACQQAQLAFEAAIANMDEPWSDLVEQMCHQSGMDATDWVDEDTLHAACELDILDSWRIPMARVLAEYLFFFDGDPSEAFSALGKHLND